MPEDLAKKLENDIQKATDDAVKNIDAAVEAFTKMLDKCEMKMEI